MSRVIPGFRGRGAATGVTKVYTARGAVGRAALVFAIATAGLVACGSDGDRGGTSGGTSGTNPPGTNPPGTNPPGTTDPPGPKRDLPLAVPSLGGYTLVDAFPGLKVTIPAAMVWPKVAGKAPFILDRTGGVKEVVPGTAGRSVLDFSDEVAVMSEGGALGMALHPQFGDGTGASPYAYFWYNASGTPKNKQRLVRFTWSAADNRFDRASETILLEEEEEKAEHNAGRLAFGADGFLYFGNGDDINDANHQRIDRALFAGIFRIDVDQKGGAISHAPPKQPAGGYSQGYFIPNDNPFVGTAGALEEYYALGVRNPFAIAFDRQTNDLWVADVGDSWREEVNLVTKGGNLEWPHKEGEVTRGGTAPTIGTPTAPKYSYTHWEMADLTAIMGGFVYRGKEHPELAGKYIYSDWPSNRVWALDVTKTPATRTSLVENQVGRVPMAWAEDNDGEIYLLHFDGVLKLAKDSSASQVPKRLSETTLFIDVAALTIDPSFVPYEINSPLWSDGAAKRRFVRVPAGKKATLAADGRLTFPVGTLFVKHFELPAAVVPQGGRSRRLETRVLVVGDTTTYGVTYRWNREGTDADLVLEPASEDIVDDATKQTRSWAFPGFGQCWGCHRSESRVLGFTGKQVSFTLEGGKKQLDVLVERGVFDAATVAQLPPPLTRPSDNAASIQDRALAYLAANCSGCHHEGASYLGGGETWNASPDVALADRGLVGAPHHNYPMASALSLPSAPLVAPGNPAGSILLARMKSTNPDLRMPPLARNLVDDEGTRLVEQWIQSLTPP